jgi:hypothetical protein
MISNNNKNGILTIKLVIVAYPKKIEPISLKDHGPYETESTTQERGIKQNF